MNDLRLKQLTVDTKPFQAFLKSLGKNYMYLAFGERLHAEGYVFTAQKCYRSFNPTTNDTLKWFEVSANQLCDVVSKGKAKQLKLTLSGSKLTIEAEGQCSLMLKEQKNYRSYEPKTTSQFYIFRAHLEEMLKATINVVNISKSPSPMNTLQLEFRENEFAIVATDGYRLHRASKQVQTLFTLNANIPQAHLKPLMDFLKSVDTLLIQIKLGHGFIQFVSDNEVIQLTTENVDLPDYKRVYPIQCAAVFKIDLGFIGKQLKQLAKVYKSQLVTIHYGTAKTMFYLEKFQVNHTIAADLFLVSGDMQNAPTQMFDFEKLFDMCQVPIADLATVYPTNKKMVMVMGKLEQSQADFIGIITTKQLVSFTNMPSFEPREPNLNHDKVSTPFGVTMTKPKKRGAKAK